MSMRLLPVALVAALLGASCAGNRQAVRSEVRGEVVRADSFAAVRADDLQVTLHDVTILPLDTPRIRVEIREVELTRASRSRVESTAAEQRTEAAATSETPVPRPANPWPWLFAFGIVAMLLNRLHR